MTVLLMMMTPAPAIICFPSRRLHQSSPEEQHLQELLVEHMARQGCYAPSRGYLDHLLQQQQGRPPPAAPAAIIPDDPHGVAAARSRGVHYIIYAFGRLGLSAATAFNAVNYLDRFLFINCHLRWEAWMVELVSVACLSVACKLEEVDAPPSLHHLQVYQWLHLHVHASSMHMGGYMLVRMTLFSSIPSVRITR
ncbi:putative cyclin-D7-1 [Dichanthelium oligosanthes]|uniref:Putative cyclin-D7-1 n=1 Tax=Dichanthelium oligosanthes TaxID=888268 RepID=A0A1E5VNQ8_9POAL|nr:putative cyclin-D7-1 [Dichanthelium oligosanthes]